MAYYMRYTTRKKGLMLGFSMLQLVTSEPKAVAIPEAQPTQSLPCSCSVPAHLGYWHWFPCTRLPSSGHSAHDIVGRALKLILTSKFPPSEDVPLLTLWAGHHTYFHRLFVEWWATCRSKGFFCSSYLDLPILDQATLRRSLLLGFSSPLNLRMRFL
jgi:hypothetical protein